MLVIGSECINKRMNQIDVLSRGLGDRFHAYSLYQIVKRRRAEFEHRFYTIYADVIVKQFITRSCSQLGCDRQLTGGRRSMNDYQFHNVLLPMKTGWPSKQNATAAYL